MISSSDDDGISTTIKIISALPNPVGKDAGHETVTLKNSGTDTDLSGWRLENKSYKKVNLSGTINGGTSLTITLPKNKMPLNNKGDDIILIDANGKDIHSVSYTESQVKEGVEIEF